MSPDPATASALLELDAVDFDYGGAAVIRDISLTVRPGSYTGLVGPSGSGKTTLLKLLLGSLRPRRGSVHRRRGLRTAYVPQLETVNWNFPVTVGECVLMARSGRRMLPWATSAEKREVAAVLDRLGIGGLQRRHIRELSGGQQQRMFIARALLRRPDLLLMDEPTSGVDIATRHEVLHLLADLNREGLSILLTTHDLNGMAAHLPQLVALHTTVIAAGPPAEVIVPAVLERTFGARVEVLQHLGVPVVVDDATAVLRSVG